MNPDAIDQLCKIFHDLLARVNTPTHFMVYCQVSDELAEAE